MKAFISPLSSFIDDPDARMEAAEYLITALNGIVLRDKPRLGNASVWELENVERVLAALMCQIRGRFSSHFPDRFVARNAMRKELELLEKAIENLKLTAAWKDHIRGVDIGSHGGPIPAGPALIAEPYQLGADDFEDFLLMEKEGWKVFIYQSFATHFPGRTTCVVLRPPITQVVERSKRNKSLNPNHE